MKCRRWVPCYRTQVALVSECRSCVTLSPTALPSIKFFTIQARTPVALVKLLHLSCRVSNLLPLTTCPPVSQSSTQLEERCKPRSRISDKAACSRNRFCYTLIWATKNASGGKQLLWPVIKLQHLADHVTDSTHDVCLIPECSWSSCLRAGGILVGLAPGQLL